VVVPLYNGAAHIDETLTSIHRQSLRPLEVIVVDDGSTDDGAARARAHPVGANVLSQENLGVAVSRNRGLSVAEGDLITFLDQDDLWHPDHLRRAVEWLASHPGERFLFVREIAFTTLDESERLSDMDRLAGGWASIRVPRASALTDLVERADVSGSTAVQFHDLRALLRGPISTTTSFIAEKELLRLAGGFAPHARAMDDYWLLVNVARLAPIPQLDQPTVFYRVHTEATSRTTSLGLPFLSSAAALRLGGGLIPVQEGMRGGLDGDLHRHLLRELLISPQYRDRKFRAAVDDLARLIWPPSGHRSERWRARLAARLPWLKRAVRALTHRSTRR
jgi:hypothetical protein